ARASQCAPDLVIEQVQQIRARCPTLVVQAQVVNQGCLGVGPGVEVTLQTSDGQRLGRTATQAPLPAGRIERVELVVEGLGNNFDLSVVVSGDTEGRFNECVEDNNAAAAVDVSCRVEL
ncbi:MAG: hypothetical protein AAF449_07530, partial [Myxococcota bacterium]